MLKLTTLRRVVSELMGGVAARAYSPSNFGEVVFSRLTVWAHPPTDTVSAASRNICFLILNFMAAI